MSILQMFGPHPQDSERDLAFKIDMVNAFGRAGVGSDSERDEAVATLRQAMQARESQTALAVALAKSLGKMRPAQYVETTRDHGEQ